MAIRVHGAATASGFISMPRIEDPTKVLVHHKEEAVAIAKELQQSLPVGTWLEVIAYFKHEHFEASIHGDTAEEIHTQYSV